MNDDYTSNNLVVNSWQIPGGTVDLRISTNEPLPTQAWVELAVLMDVAQAFARKVRSPEAIENIRAARREVQAGLSDDPWAPVQPPRSGSGSPTSPDTAPQERVMPSQHWPLNNPNLDPDEEVTVVQPVVPHG